jgi:hypothetical protein
MEDIRCPVCGGDFVGRVGVSSHLFKNKDADHRRFVQQQDVMIDQAFFTDVSCETIATSKECWVSTVYICGRWRKLPGHKERKSRMDSLRMKREWQSGQRELPKGFTNAGQPYDLDKHTTIDKGQYDQIVALFSSDLGIIHIAQQVGCNPKTVGAVFVREFGKQTARERGRRLASQICGRTVAGHNRIDPSSERGKPVIDAFHGEEGIRTVSARLDVGTTAIVRLWKQEFGQEAYKARCAKLLCLQRERSARTLDKARFAGSKNEILCHRLLAEILPDLEVKHHDYSIVPKLELDITVPTLKIAITWDGVCHRRPVFGKKAFHRVCANDQIRERVLPKKGWRHISVVDDGGSDPAFVQRIVNEIVAALRMEWQGKLELR